MGVAKVLEHVMDQGTHLFAAPASGIAPGAACVQISAQEYADQAKAGTEKALSDTLRKIMDGTTAVDAATKSALVAVSLSTLRPGAGRSVAAACRGLRRLVSARAQDFQKFHPKIYDTELARSMESLR